MGVLAAEIPDAYLVAVLVATLSLIAWIVRELSRISRANGISEIVTAHLEKRVNDHEERLRDLEEGQRTVQVE